VPESLAIVCAMATLPDDLVILAVGAKPRGGPRPGYQGRTSAILTIYGLVLTAAGLLVQSGAIAPAAGAHRRALAWRTYLWAGCRARRCPPRR
jgi:hypothetical protein